jgi:hypothetical protein
VGGEGLVVDRLGEEWVDCYWGEGLCRGFGGVGVGLLIGLVFGRAKVVEFIAFPGAGVERRV